MPLNWEAAFWVSAFATVTWGCASDCTDTTRLNGDWEVYARVADDRWQVSGFNTDSTDAAEAERASIEQAELLAQLPVNTTSTWNLRRDGTSDNYVLQMDGQEFDARIVPKKGACNAFDVRFSGLWSGAEGSAHNFTFDGQITFLGDGLSGSWKYSDNFSWDDRETTGAVAIPYGVLSATRDGSDSGL